MQTDSQWSNSALPNFKHWSILRHIPLRLRHFRLNSRHSHNRHIKSHGSRDNNRNTNNGTFLQPSHHLKTRFSTLKHPFSLKQQLPAKRNYNKQHQFFNLNITPQFIHDLRGRNPDSLASMTKSSTLR